MPISCSTIKFSDRRRARERSLKLCISVSRSVEPIQSSAEASLLGKLRLISTEFYVHPSTALGAIPSANNTIDTFIYEPCVAHLFTFRQQLVSVFLVDLEDCFLLNQSQKITILHSDFRSWAMHDQDILNTKHQDGGSYLSGLLSGSARTQLSGDEDCAVRGRERRLCTAISKS